MNTNIFLILVLCFVVTSCSQTENINEKNSSDLFFPNLLLIPEITGIKAAFIEPSAKSLRKRFGSLKDIKNASETSPAPITFAIKRSLIYPKILLKNVKDPRIEIILRNIF